MRVAIRQAGYADGTACADTTAGRTDWGRIMPGLDDLKKLADDHDDQVDQGLGKAGDAAGAKFGHEDQIGKGVDWAQQHTGDGDQQPSDPQDTQQS